MTCKTSKLGRTDLVFGLWLPVTWQRWQLQYWIHHTWKRVNLRPGL